ncbi:hypothetical protein [Streptomyces sp. SYSU K21746]
MLNDVVSITSGTLYRTSAVSVEDHDAAIVLVQPVMRCEHGYDVTVCTDEDLLARVSVTGTQVMLHVPFYADTRSVRVELENINGCTDHPHTYEIRMEPYGE